MSNNGSEVRVIGKTSQENDLSSLTFKKVMEECRGDVEFNQYINALKQYVDIDDEASLLLSIPVDTEDLFDKGMLAEGKKESSVDTATTSAANVVIDHTDERKKINVLNGDGCQWRLNFEKELLSNDNYHNAFIPLKLINSGAKIDRVSEDKFDLSRALTFVKAKNKVTKADCFVLLGKPKDPNRFDLLDRGKNFSKVGLNLRDINEAEKAKFTKDSVSTSAKGGLLSWFSISNQGQECSVFDEVPIISPCAINAVNITCINTKVYDNRSVETIEKEIKDQLKSGKMSVSISQKKITTIAGQEINAILQNQATNAILQNQSTNTTLEQRIADDKGSSYSRESILVEFRGLGTELKKPKAPQTPQTPQTPKTPPQTPQPPKATALKQNGIMHIPNTTLKRKILITNKGGTKLEAALQVGIITLESSVLALAVIALRKTALAAKVARDGGSSMAGFGVIIAVECLVIVVASIFIIANLCSLISKSTKGFKEIESEYVNFREYTDDNGVVIYGEIVSKVDAPGDINKEEGYYILADSSDMII